MNPVADIGISFILQNMTHINCNYIKLSIWLIMIDEIWLKEYNYRYEAVYRQMLSSCLKSKQYLNL